MEQGPARVGTPWTGTERGRILEALPDALVAANPHRNLLIEMSEATGVNGYFLFAPASGQHRTQARMFGPAIGIDEDPVNGSGHGALGAYLEERGGQLGAAVREGFWSGMGHHLGRPGDVWVRTLKAPRGGGKGGGGYTEVGGFVTPVFEARIHVPTGTQ